MPTKPLNSRVDSLGQRFCRSQNPYPTRNVVHVTCIWQTITCMLWKTCMLQSCFMNVTLGFLQHACHMHVHMHVMWMEYACTWHSFATCMQHACSIMLHAANMQVMSFNMHRVYRIFYYFVTHTNITIIWLVIISAGWQQLLSELRSLSKDCSRFLSWSLCLSE